MSSYENLSLYPGYSNLGVLRQKRGLSASDLAKTVGVSRQTIYAIEAGSYVPNTVVAIRLARALETTVEELFPLAEEAPAAQLRSEAGNAPARFRKRLNPARRSSYARWTSA